MKDFHIHYYLDGCAKPEMTLPNIDRLCAELGIEEAAVLKHYSAALPNGKDDWVFWHKIRPEQFARYLEEFASYTPQFTKLHSGVETELCNEAGDINIPPEAQNRVELVQLSVHCMIDLDCLPMDLPYYPTLATCPEEERAAGRAAVEAWKQKAADAGPENIIAGLVNGYMNAIRRFPKVRSMAHMADGLKPLRAYLIDVDRVPVARQIEILEPLMRLAAERGVFWELLDEPANPAILRRAKELGVVFTASADAHQLYEGWGPLTGHKAAEEAKRRLLGED